VAPPDNPVTAAKVELGRHLFYDPRLSGDGTYACATCHRPELAFTDGRARALGLTGELHPRSSMSLANAAYSATLTWADPHLERLEQQLLIPMLGEGPLEMGISLRAEPRYRKLFAKAFPGNTPAMTVPQIVKALASFVRTLISGNSPYDRYVYWGEDEQFSDAARQGMRLFFSERLRCSGCHAGFNLSGPVTYLDGPKPEPEFHNTGLYNVDGWGAYPDDDTGLYLHTRREEDMGRFRAPTLRNIALTAPYMHDGSVPTLEEVIAHYAAGGRMLRTAQGPGLGRDGGFKSPQVSGFEISEQETLQLLAFLESLTDRSFVRDSRFADPWRAKPAARNGPSVAQNPQVMPMRTPLPDRSRVPKP
jgi:cytochrome c peroxidase